MPIYEYKCIKCSNIFSALQSMSASEKDTICPACGSREVRKMLSTFSSSMGSGFSPAASAPACGGGGGG